MASTSNAKSEPWISFLWNIENYSYCWHKDKYIETPVMELKENITWYVRVFPRAKQYRRMYLSFSGKSQDEYEIIEVETDFALMTEDAFVWHRKPRYKPRTLDKGVFQWQETLLNLDELADTKRKRFMSGDT
ncbi:hypothetical protein TNCT_667541 [Trichonephila clavata]|uniref:Uncharacterized protein n=1 Tax=Trichonephila clavata TaxID=2740835 RepID=A0A8X6M228_TRICU|nr:hypothetical protein TNCT_667541 [Trichonephila clavata]